MARNPVVVALALIAACASEESGPSNRARQILEDSRYNWVSLEAAGARIHYAEGSYADGEREVLADRVESARRAILEGLGLCDYPETIDVFYVDAREDMRQLTGSPVTGFAFIEGQAVVLVFNEDWRAFERHELTHVISRNAWGEPGEPSAATLEGFAVYMDGDCGGYEVGRVARTLLEMDLMLDRESLLGAFRAQDDLIAYLQVASLVEYVDGQGIEGVLPRLWSGGLGAAPELLGVSWSEFEGGWSDWMRASYTPIPDPAWERIRAGGCGIVARPARG
ncbi:MAG: hypothetical protein JSV86_06130 [Gemmatimonadota bacterium]|nr:MAG: hypothetical protein JSV86_06130 [Gemmatimonadota bacterium]